jgi:hypothetical protein
VNVIDVFVSHAWRYHPEWLHVCELLSANSSSTLRNFSLPWHDPAYAPASELGAKHLMHSLEVQIYAVDIVFVIDALLVNKSAEKWVKKQIEIANRFNKKICLITDQVDHTLYESVIEDHWRFCSYEASEIKAVLEGVTTK